MRQKTVKWETIRLRAKGEFLGWVEAKDKKAALKVAVKQSVTLVDGGVFANNPISVINRGAGSRASIVTRTQSLCASTFPQAGGGTP